MADKADDPHRHLPTQVGEAEVTGQVVDDRAEPAERARHNAFTDLRKKKFLEALGKTGCILDACRTLRVSSSTVYNHQRSDPDFRHHCELALHMAATTVEIMAWERGVVGIEEEVVRYNKVVTVRKRSDSILRLLLQGANPKKYGPRPGFSRKRMLKHERQQMEREIRAEIKAKRPSSISRWKCWRSSLRPSPKETLGRSSRPAGQGPRKATGYRPGG